MVPVQYHIYVVSGSIGEVDNRLTHRGLHVFGPLYGKDKDNHNGKKNTTGNVMSSRVYIKWLYEGRYRSEEGNY